jgi:hypothetical protein
MWLFSTGVLVGSLLEVAVLNRSVGRDEPDATADAIARYGFRLEERSREAGVAVVHTAPTFDRQLANIMPQVASTGASVAIADFDRDGWQDLYITNSGEGSQNHLYRNQHDGTFKDVASEMGVADVNRVGTGVSMGAVWGDYDNDGYEDLFVFKYGRPELFHNEQGKRFVAVGERAGLPRWINANSAIWLDFDRDGLLDLFVAGYWPDAVDLWNLKTTRIMPESFEYANNGGRKYLLRNKGDGTFEDVTISAGLTSTRWTLAAVAGDLMGTGYPDLFLSNDYGISQLYANRNGKRFEEVGRSTGIGKTPKSGMNASLGDVFNDGRLSIYKSNISEPGILVQANDLWVPTRDASGAITFDDMASTLGVDLGGWSWGAQFGDLNNDGGLDLYLTNGYVSAGERTSYWYDFAQIAVGHSSIIADARNWPAMNGRSLSGYQPKRAWMNDGFGRFTDVSQAVGVIDRHDGRAVALADLFNTGALDVVVANQRGPLLLYRNTVQPGRRWIAFDLEGRVSNRSAIGAHVALYWDGHVQVQEVNGGSGFSAQNERRLHFGLGSSAQVDRVIIRWPSGLEQMIEHPGVDRIHHITEPGQ